MSYEMGGHPPSSWQARRGTAAQRAKKLGEKQELNVTLFIFYINLPCSIVQFPYEGESEEIYLVLHE